MLETIDNLIEFARMRGVEPTKIIVNTFTGKIFLESCQAYVLAYPNELKEITSKATYRNLKVTVIEDYLQKIHIEIL